MSHQVSPSLSKSGRATSAPAQTKFAFTCVLLQAVAALLFVLLVRYDDNTGSARSKKLDNDGKEMEGGGPLQVTLLLDVHVMLLLGFGLLMSFPRRLGLTAMAMTVMVVAIAGQWAILFAGLARMGSSAGQGATIHIGMHDLLEAGLAAAAILISLGAVLGRVNPFQALLMSLAEAAVFVMNSHVGYSVMGVIDVGGSIYVHAFGAYFGLAVSLALTHRSSSSSSNNNNNNNTASHTSDVLATVGTFLLWVFWPAFNAALALDSNSRARAVVNTHISLAAATAATFALSAFLGRDKKFSMVDLQNASLSGGVAVGAVADLMLQPYGALLLGLAAGVVSTLGYRRLSPSLVNSRIRLEDTCGVHNLHGMPAVLSAVVSAGMCAAATEEQYGDSFALVFPLITAGSRSYSGQAAWQLAGIMLTLAVASLSGLIIGVVLSVDSLFHPPGPKQQFLDDPFFELSPEENDGKEVGEDENFHDIAA